MDRLNTNNIASGVFIAAGAYLLTRFANRLYRSTNDSTTSVLTMRDIAMREGCTFTTGIFGSVFLFAGLENIGVIPLKFIK